MLLCASMENLIIMVVRGGSLRHCFLIGEAHVCFWLSDAPIKINIPNPNVIQSNSKTRVVLEQAGDLPLASNTFERKWVISLIAFLYIRQQ